MKIINLKSENVKRLRAVEISPDGSAIVVVGGRNSQGKSSVLDSIAMALGGAEEIPGEPVRRGEKSATIVVELDDLIVERTIKPDGKTALVVRGRDGIKRGTPQTILDRMTGAFTFDPLAFSRQDAKGQAETLRKLLGLDFADLDRRRAEVFAKRTDVNRDMKAIEARRNAIVVPPDAPTEPVDVASLTAELGRAQAAINMAAASNRDRAEIEKRIAAEIQQLAKLRLQLKDCPENQEIPDTAPILERINAAAALNRAHASRKDRASLDSQVEAKTQESRLLGMELEEVESKKRGSLEAAVYPVPGLALGEDGVTYQGIPLAQASSSEQLRVSVAMGIALAPELRVMLIRDGSLLDADSLEIVRQMAEKADAQIWIERVGDGDEGAVVIEDGEVSP
jgi:DNA repair exonuclease SbcCD ATPase subunit